MYVVMRNCCTSGNCFHCTRLTPFGTPARIEQARYEDVNLADGCAKNWREYKTEIVEVQGPHRDLELGRVEGTIKIISPQ